MLSFFIQLFFNKYQKVNKKNSAPFQRFLSIALDISAPFQRLGSKGKKVVVKIDSVPFQGQLSILPILVSFSLCKKVGEVSLWPTPGFRPESIDLQPPQWLFIFCFSLVLNFHTTRGWSRLVGSPGVHLCVRISLLSLIKKCWLGLNFEEDFFTFIFWLRRGGSELCPGLSEVPFSCKQHPQSLFF